MGTGLDLRRPRRRGGMLFRTSKLALVCGFIASLVAFLNQAFDLAGNVREALGLPGGQVPQPAPSRAATTGDDLLVEIEAALIKLQLYDGQATGRLTPGVRSAIAHAERKYGLQADGLPDRPLLDLLRAQVAG